MDSIANMLAKLKNAGEVGKKQVEVSYSKLNLAILENLKNRGFINKFEVKKNEKQKYPAGINVYLKYKGPNDPQLTDISRVSRPGRRIYIRSREIGRKNPQSEIIISTSKGIMTGSEAKKNGLGGEVICEVE